MDLPNDLRLALERALRDARPAAVAAAAADLSARYRAGHGTSAADSPYVSDAVGAAAYAAARMPATFGAAAAAARATAAALPGFAPRSLLDVGGGTGSALWAAAETWASLARATVIEREPAMLALGHRLAAAGRHPALPRAAWRAADLTAPWEAEPHDLVTAAYVLGELDERPRAALVERLWSLAAGALLIVEPGTPRGFAIVRAARARLIALGAQIVAPCPHAAECPMAGGDWCHFAQRVARTREQRRAKNAELGYEDEKYSYVAAARASGLPIGGRVLRRPAARPGRVDLVLCAPEGLCETTISRSDPRWREARDLRWGDALVETESEKHRT